MSDFLFGLLLLGPLLSTGVCAVYGLQRGSYLRSSTKSEMKFLAPRSIVVFPVTMLAWIFWWCASPISLNLLLSGWRNILSDTQATEWLLGSGLFLGGLYWGVLHWYGKRCPIILNIARRTYRVPDLVGGNFKVQNGSWDEIEGICLKRTHAKGTTIHYVSLKWNKSSSLASRLGGFSKQEKAEAFATELSKELGLPLVVAHASGR